ncbi:MAG: EAL domain-containing protein [Candidatus Competibacter denitrificans]
MNQADAQDNQDNQDNQRAILVNHLKLVDDLWQKLFYVKWSTKSFAMLERLAQDMLQFAQSDGEEQLLKLIIQLEHHVKSCLAAAGLPQESDRQRLTALIEALHEALATGKEGNRHDQPLTLARFTPFPQIVLITPDETTTTLAKLDEPRYQVLRINDLTEAERYLRERPPGAVILDMDFPEGSERVLGLIANLRAQAYLQVPLLVCSERSDMAARLEAVRAGAAAYFSKPVDHDELWGILGELLLPQMAANYYRVLIVNDRPSEAWEIAGTLEEQGVTPLVVIQPLQVLQDIHRFRPDLLIIDLDIKEVAGAELAQVIAQHRECDFLPIILLCFQADMAHYLANLDLPGATLLVKPMPPSHLCWEVKQRVRRSRSVRVRLNALSNSDGVSGFHNRRRFLMLLEQSFDTLGLRARSLAVLLVVLDNLHSIRDAAGVATADEIIGQAASRLHQVLAQDQHAARFGDAVFAVMVPNLVGEPLMHLARRIRDTLENGYYKVGEQALLVRIRVGMAVATDRTQDHLMLVQRADSACTMAREAKSERIYAHQNILAVKRDQEISSRTQLLEQVQDIFDQERLWLVFQPIVSIRGDAVERYEVLLRLRDRENLEIVPGSVFGVVHNHQLGLKLDRWVIEHAIEVLRQRRSPITLFIKILPITLQDRTLSTWLRGRLEQAEVEAERIVFEVAEATAERSLRDMFGFLGGIKLLGCGFCLDRFGRGSDSLGLLKNLGADYVKLDMYLVNGLARDPAKQAQLQDLVQSLEALGAATIVGGVEDVKTMPILWSLGVNLIQGFFLQQPYREMSYDFANAAF